MKKALIIVLLLQQFILTAQEYIPTPENLQNRAEFQDDKFGLFIHWGIYSVLGVHEWVMETNKIDKKTYEKISHFFNPTEFKAEEWVLMAKNAGMKYITITAKHHDGFAMFDSKQTSWDIMDRTPYKKDIIKAMADACHKHDIKLYLYYSQLDWNHNDYYPRGSTGKSTGRPEEGNWDNYIDYMNNQLTELLTNYGKISGLWFDGWWDRKEADWRLDETYKLIHKLQPATMIGSNHHLAPKPGEDFQMFEKDLPGQNHGGFSGESEVGILPLETAETMAERWGFSLQDKNYKSEKELIQYLVKAAGYNSNFLLNVGPMPNGKIQEEYIEMLEKIGTWTSTYGESIYGTRGGPIEPQTWGVSTHNNDNIFVHILDWKDQHFILPLMDQKIESIKSFATGQPLDFKITDFGTIVQLPQGFEKEIDYILIIESN